MLPTHRLIVPRLKVTDVEAFRAALGEWYVVEESQMDAEEALACARGQVTEESGRMGRYLGGGRCALAAPTDKERLIEAVPGETSRAVKGLTVDRARRGGLAQGFWHRPGGAGGRRNHRVPAGRRRRDRPGRSRRGRGVDLRPGSRAPGHPGGRLRRRCHAPQIDVILSETPHGTRHERPPRPVAE